MSNNDEPSSTIVASEPSPDGKSYITTISIGDDISATLTPQQALKHAAAVITAAEHAAYDAAVARQFHVKVGMPMDIVAAALDYLRNERPPLDTEALTLFTLEPGVNHDLEPFLTVLLDGEPIGQWDITDAQQHALGAIVASVAADSDNTYYRFLTGRIDIDSERARTIVDDLSNWRTMGAL